MERFVLLRNSIFNCQVCAASDASPDEVLEWVRDKNPAGTQGNWGHADIETVPCADDKERTHHVFRC